MNIQSLLIKKYTQWYRYNLLWVHKVNLLSLLLAICLFWKCKNICKYINVSFFFHWFFSLFTADSMNHFVISYVCKSFLSLNIKECSFCYFRASFFSFTTSCYSIWSKKMDPRSNYDNNYVIKESILVSGL